jgi:hypothetical protein
MPHVDRLASFLVASKVGRVVRVCGPLPDVILQLERQARARGLRGAPGDVRGGG